MFHLVFNKQFHVILTWLLNINAFRSYQLARREVLTKYHGANEKKIVFCIVIIKYLDMNIGSSITTSKSPF